MIREDRYPDVLYKYLDFEGGLSMIQKQELWFTRATNLNDPYDCYLTYRKGKDTGFSEGFWAALNSIFGKIGICSLCIDPCIFTMWSYYNQHRGLCVGLKMEALNSFFSTHPWTERNKTVCIRKIIYQEDVAGINPYEIEPQNLQNITDHDCYKALNAIYDFLAVKAKYWENENEYRLILRGGNRLEKDEPQKVIIENIIDSVYLGCKSLHDTSRIFELAKERKFNVYRMNINPRQYELVPKVLYEV